LKSDLIRRVIVAPFRDPIMINKPVEVSSFLSPYG
jgi:hypothetical protein